MAQTINTGNKSLAVRAEPEQAPHGVFPSEDKDFDIESELDLIENPITARDLYTKARYFGMPMNYLAVGVIYGGQGSILYPIYQIILKSPQNYQNAIGSVVALFWSFKIFYGFLSDSVPIFGKRRKPYLVFGWVGSTILTAIQAIYIGSQETQWYCYKLNSTTGAYYLLNKDVVVDECPLGTEWSTKSLNKESFDGNWFIVLMFLTNFMYMFADIACDSLAVEYAHREPANQRGRIQAYNYCMRFMTTCLTFVISAFALNTPLFKGDFTAGLSMSAYLWVLAAGQAVGIPFYFIMEEENVDPTKLTTFGYKLGQAWQLLQNKAFAALMIFNVTYNCFTSVGVVGANGLAGYWVDVSALQNNFSGIFQYVAITLTIYINGRYFIEYSWRCLQSFGLITSTIMGLLSLIIIYDVNRNPWFWIFTQVDSTILSMIGWMTAIWATNEMAPPGLEGTALALSTTANNAAISVATYFRNLIGGLFPLLTSDNGEEDYAKPEAQDQYAYNLYIVMGINLFGLVFMWLLPHQKAQARRRFETWGSHIGFGFTGLGIVGVAMFYGSITNLSTLFCPCSSAWGGPGCVEGTCEYPPKELGNVTGNATLLM